LAQNNSNLFWDNSNQRLGIGTTSPSDGLTVRKSSSTTVGIDSINTNTTSPTANAQVFVGVAGANAGDPVTVYDIPGAARWTVGVDNDQSDKFKIACSGPAGFITPMTVTTDGNVGVDEVNPTARLHIASGTASLPALKLTAGAKLSSPQAGDLEFDGTQFWITQTGGQRRSLIPAVADVMDFGAVGDGMVDDSAAFQAAVSTLVDTGGIVWVPPGRKYIVSNVTINAKYPVWIMSGMGGHAVGGAPDSSSQNDKASIVPPPSPATPTHIFKWERNSVFLNNPGAGAGGGIVGITINDIATNGGSPRATTISAAAVWIDDAADFTMRDCMIQFIKGTAIRVDESTYCRLLHSRIDQCGVEETETEEPKPVIDMGGQATQAFVWTDGLFIQGNHNTHIRIQSEGALWHRNSYHENSGLVPNDVLFIDATHGAATISGCQFRGNTTTSIILGHSGGLGIDGNLGNYIENCTFETANGTNAIIQILGPSAEVSGAHATKLSGLQFYAGGQAGPSIDCGAHFCQMDDIFINLAGRINISGIGCRLSNIFIYASTAPEDQYCIDFNPNVAPWGSVNGATIEGANVTEAHGIRAYCSNISGVLIRQLAGTANGIVSTGIDCDVIVGCTVVENAGGTPFVYTQGTKAYGNFGFTKTASASSGAATLDAECGTITTEPLTTAHGSAYYLTLTNSCVRATSQVFASCDFGGATQGTPIIGISRGGNGLALIELRNIHATQDFGGGDGTYKIHFKVVN
jgi:hypothetical protein